MSCCNGGHMSCCNGGHSNMQHHRLQHHRLLGWEPRKFHLVTSVSYRVAPRWQNSMSRFKLWTRTSSSSSPSWGGRVRRHSLAVFYSAICMCGPMFLGPTYRHIYVQPRVLGTYLPRWSSSSSSSSGSNNCPCPHIYIERERERESDELDWILLCLTHSVQKLQCSQIGDHP